MKYVTYRDGYEKIIIFGATEKHDQMVDKLGIEEKNILGAGFVCLYVDEPYCYGESTSLMRGCRKDEDTRLLRILANI